MSRVIVQMQVSLDGYVAAADPDLSWQVWDWSGPPTWDSELSADFNAAFTGVTTILLSRAMITGGYLDHWAATARAHPDDPRLAFARRIGEVDNIVVSRAQVPARWPRRPPPAVRSQRSCASYRPRVSG